MKRRPATNPTPKRAITRNRDWRQPFLHELAATGIVSAACAEAGIDRHTAYMRRKKDEKFRRQWRAALDDAADLLEREARRRAEQGVDEPVVYQGVLAGQWIDEAGNPCQHNAPGAKFVPLTIKRYSDALMMFLLRGARPKKYRDRVNMQHSGKVTHKHSATKNLVSKLTGDAEAAAAAKVLAKRAAILSDN